MNHEHEVAYISGAISSDPRYKEKFANAQMVLESLGYYVISPTMIPPVLTEDEHMLIDLRFVEVSDVIVMLPDWKKSNGAPVERDHAFALKKRIIPYKGVDTDLPRW